MMSYENLTTYVITKHTPLKPLHDLVLWWSWWVYREYRFLERSIEFLSLDNLRGSDMASHKVNGKTVADKQPTQPVKEVPFRGFANIVLEDADFEVIDARLANDSQAVLAAESLVYLVEFGKVSISHRNGSYNCTLVVSNGLYGGIAVSSFSDVVLEAIAITAYKYEKFGTDLAVYLGNGRTAKRG